MSDPESQLGRPHCEVQQLTLIALQLRFALVSMIQNNMALSHKEIIRRFDIRPEHTLTEPESDARVHKKHNAICDTKWFIELDNRQKVVARYRSWISRSLKPPYRQQFGWERYSASGELMDREVRYHERDTMEYLH